MDTLDRVACGGSTFSRQHEAALPVAYSVILRDGTVVYCCDTDCLERVLLGQADEVRGTVRGWRPLRHLAQLLETA
jgi:hypothetical protein